MKNLKLAYRLAIYNIVRDFKQVKLLFLTVVFGMAIMLTGFISISSFIKYREELNNIQSDGYDIVLFDIPSKEYINHIEELKEDENIDIFEVTNNIGYSKINNNYNEKEYLFIQEITSKTLQMENVTLKSGKLPTNSKEVIIPLEYAKIMDIKEGDLIDLELINLTYKDTSIEKYISRLYHKYIYLNNEKINYNETDNEKTYLVSGIYEASMQSYTNDMTLDHYYIYSLLDHNIEEDGYVDLQIRFLNKDVEYINYTNMFGVTTHTNAGLSMYEVPKVTISFSPQLKIITYLIMTILIFGILVFAINSAFQYGNTERKIYFSRLTQVGVTSKELKSAWNLQTFLITLFAIPLGICLTLLFLYFSLIISFDYINVNEVLKELLTPSIISFSLIVMVIAVLTVNIVVEEKILYVLPLDALKGKQERIKTKYVHYSQTTKLDGEIGKYLKSNYELKSNLPSQFFVFTVAISVACIMLLFSFNMVATKPIINYLQKKSATFTINVEGNKDYIDFLNDVSKIEEVNDYSITRKSEELYYTLIEKTNLSEIGQYLSSIDDYYYKVPLEVRSINDEKFQEYGGSTQNFVILNEMKLNSKDKFLINKIPEGSYNNLKIENSSGEILYDYPQYYVSKNKNLSLNPGYLTMLVKDSYLDELLNTKENHKTIELLVINEQSFKTHLNELLKEKYPNLIINITNQEVDKLSTSNYIYVSFVTVYLTLLIVAVLYIISLESYVKNYTKSREQELGLLKTMGASSKDLKTIIYKEVFRSYIISLIAGLILGILANIGLSMFFKVETVEYINITKNAIISGVIILLSLLIVLGHSVNSATKTMKNKYPYELIKDIFKEF